MTSDATNSPRRPDDEVPSAPLPDATLPQPTQAGASAPADPPKTTGGSGRKSSFGEDFRRFFVGGLKTLLPTLITLWLLFWIWDFLWLNIGRHVIWVIKWTWLYLQDYALMPESWFQPPGRIRQIFDEDSFKIRLLGVGIAVLLVYIVGVLVGNLIGRTVWRLMERAVMRLPLIRAVYPSVKQVTDFLLADRSARGGGGGQFSGSRVVAVQARHQGVWSIGLVTGRGYGPLNEAIRGDMVTVFIPSSPTAVAGYVVVAHRDRVVDLPLTVEEALRLLVSGGVLMPDKTGAAKISVTPAGPAVGSPHDEPALPVVDPAKHESEQGKTHAA